MKGNQRETERDRERDRDRETERDRDRERQRETERDRERQRERNNNGDKSSYARLYKNEKLDPQSKRNLTRNNWKKLRERKCTVLSSKIGC